MNTRNKGVYRKGFYLKEKHSYSNSSPALLKQIKTKKKNNVKQSRKDQATAKAQLEPVVNYMNCKICDSLKGKI